MPLPVNDGARAEARLADDLIRQSDNLNLPPLGVPRTVKEYIV